MLSSDTKLLLLFHKISLFLSPSLSVSVFLFLSHSQLCFFPSSQVVLCYRSLSATFPWKQPVWQELACCESGPVMFNMENYLPSTESLSSLVCHCKPVRAANWSCGAPRFGGKEQGWREELILTSLSRSRCVRLLRAHPHSHKGIHMIC